MITEQESKKGSGFSYNSGYGYEPSEAHHHHDVWVADFGPDGLEEELKTELAKIKPPKVRRTSWIFSTVFLLIILVAVELGWRVLAGKFFWSEMTLFWFNWGGRLLLLIIWLLIAHRRLQLESFKLFTTTIIAFAAAVIISAIIKILTVGAAWTWINMLVEPIWMILLIAVVGALGQKWFLNNKSIK